MGSMMFLFVTLVLTAVTALPVWLAAKLLSAPRQEFWRCGLVCFIGLLALPIGPLVSDSASVIFVLAVLGFAFASMYLLGLGLLRSVGLTFFATFFAVAIGCGIAQSGSDVFKTLMFATKLDAEKAEQAQQQEPEKIYR